MAFLFFCEATRLTSDDPGIWDLDLVAGREPGVSHLKNKKAFERRVLPYVDRMLRVIAAWNRRMATDDRGGS